MKDPKEITCLVVDNGLFIPFARELARHYKRVLYHSPEAEGFPTLNKCILGDGFPDIERCADIFPVLSEVDLVVFPDINHSGLQLHLEAQGLPVWGSRKADVLEIKREKFKQLQKELGMDVPPHKAVKGLSNLRAYLQENEDCYVKLSKYRGSMETWHSVNYELSRPMLDTLAVRFGPAQDELSFLVEPGIKTDIEVGYDGYCINGKFPSLGVQGFEAKDRGYIGTIQAYEEMPEQVTSVNEALAATLGEFRYRNFFSTEIRVKDDKNYLIDPCCRCPSPSTEAQLKLYGNMGDIVWYGAHGELIDPEPTAKFAAECVLTMKGDKTNWKVTQIPEKLEPWVMCGGSCMIGDQTCFPPDGSAGDEIGWLVATGDTIEETIKTLHEHVGHLDGTGITAHPEALASLIQQIRSAEKLGIEFAEQKIPKPEIALDL